MEIAPTDKGWRESFQARREGWSPPGSSSKSLVTFLDSKRGELFKFARLVRKIPRILKINRRLRLPLVCLLRGRYWADKPRGEKHSVAAHPARLPPRWELQSL